VKPSFGALSVQPLDEGEAATLVARRQGEAAVDAAFDVEGESAPGVAGEAESEGIVLMDGSEDDVGPVAGESPVDAVEFGVAPLVGSRPAGVFVDG